MKLFKAIRRWLRTRDCVHPSHRIICLHGDEINAYGGKRSVCLDCDKAFYELPEICQRASKREGFPVYHNPFIF